MHPKRAMLTYITAYSWNVTLEDESVTVTERRRKDFGLS
jgi:hypothetical protein